DKLIHLILLSGEYTSHHHLNIIHAVNNLALKGTVTQSSTQSAWVAQRAIDGKRYGSAFCSATANESNPWWRLDLLDVYNISTVIITARSDCCPERINGAEIRIGNSLDNNGNNNPICAVTSGFLAGHTISYSCHGMEGRYVNVVMTGITSHLALCEVEVFGTENLALKGTVTQSSTYYTMVAQHAIDGKRYGPGPYCFATSTQSDPWWRLDLLEVVNISTVVITALNNLFYQTSGAEIRIGNSLDNNGNNNTICAVTPDPLTENTVSYSCHGMEGRYVNVVMTGQTNNLALCEVEVYGTENLAFRGAATHSSTPWEAPRAIDGERYGLDTYTYCSATTSESNPWWRLAIQDYYDIDTVIITARSDCCEDQTNGAEIRIGNSLENNGNNNPICAVTSGFLNGNTVSYSCHGMMGRYVNVVMTGSTSALALCEVEVYGKRNS
ncbi:hypothetical protein IRJ41_021836, partial [Triplophysa rosa]